MHDDQPRAGQAAPETTASAEDGVALAARLHAAEGALGALLEHTSDLAYLADPDGRLLTVNRAWHQKLGLGGRAGGAGDLEPFIDPEGRDAYRAACRRIVAGEAGVPLALTFRAWDGAPVEVAGRLIRHEDATGPVICGLFRDLSMQRFQEARQSHLATRDSLTSLANRALFAQHLPLALARARRQGTLVGVVLVDLDAFRDINAAFGHAGGDQVLIAVGDRLQRSVRLEDLVARFEADRFGMVLERLYTSADATMVIGRTLATIMTPLLNTAGEWVRPSASVGVALSDGASDEAEALVSAAEGALRRAKRAGGERFIFAPRPDERAGVVAE